MVEKAVRDNLLKAVAERLNAFHTAQMRAG